MVARREPESDPEMRIRMRREGLELGAGVRPLHAIGIPYWEIPPEFWGDAIDGVTAMGIPALRLDLPWALHERSPGIFEWGQFSPELEVERLLDLAEARGLYVLCRPGPWIPRAPGRDGIPDRLVTAAAGSSRDFPPGPASAALLQESRAWLEFVASRIAPFVYPRGPVAAWLATGPGPVPSLWGGGLLDRSQAALSVYARFVQVKYPPASVPVGPPPLGGPASVKDLERSAAWIEAGEAAQRAAVELQLELRPDAPGSERLATLAAIPDTPFASGGDLEATRESVDSVALVFPEGRTEFRDLRMLGLRADGLSPGALVSGVPTTESLCDPMPCFDPPRAAAVLAMSGARALDLDTLVPRAARPEFGAPLDRSGNAAHGSGSAWRELFRALAAIDHPALTRRSDLLLMANRELGRLREVSSGPAPGGGLTSRQEVAIRLQARDLGLRDCPARHSDATFLGLFDGFRKAGIAFSVADTSLSMRRLSRERVLALVCFEHISRRLARRLLEWVESGGCLILGPRLPARDWMGARLRLPPPLGATAETKRGPSPVRFGALELEEPDLLLAGEPVLEHDDGVLAARYAYGRGQVVHFGFRLPAGAEERDPLSLARIASVLAHAAGVESSYAASDPAVETELFSGEVRRFLFLANSTQEDRSVTVALAAGEGLREVRGSGEYLRPGEFLSVPARAVLVRELVQL